MSFSNPSLVNDGKTTFIYILYDSTGCSRRAYVGMSIDPIRRLRNHLTPRSMSKGSFCGRWLQGLKSKGIKPKLSILEIVAAGKDYQEAERFWIQFLRIWGVELVNTTDGGHGIRGFRHSLGSRKKISDAGRGRKRSAEAEIKRANSFRISWASKIRPKKQRCVNDHQYTVENTYTDKYGWRHCKECMKIYDRRRVKNKPAGDRGQK